MKQPKLLAQVRDVIRVRHYSIRTEEAYVQWIKRYIFFHNKKHPRDMGETELTAFLTYLVDKNAAASTQNQALSALLFLYKEVLGIQLDWLEDVVDEKKFIDLSNTSATLTRVAYQYQIKFDSL